MWCFVKQILQCTGVHDHSETSGYQLDKNEFSRILNGRRHLLVNMKSDRDLESTRACAVFLTKGHTLYAWCVGQAWELLLSLASQHSPNHTGILKLEAIPPEIAITMLTGLSCCLNPCPQAAEGSGFCCHHLWACQVHAEYLHILSSLLRFSLEIISCFRKFVQDKKKRPLFSLPHNLACSPYLFTALYLW